MLGAMPGVVLLLLGVTAVGRLLSHGLVVETATVAEGAGAVA